MKLFIWETGDWNISIFALARDVAEAREMVAQSDTRNKRDNSYITKKEPRIYDHPMSIILYSDATDVYK